MTALRRAAGVIFKRVGEELVLLDYERGVYFGLDAVGARLWELIAEETTVEAVVDQLLEEYDVQRAQLYEDVVRLLGEMRDQRLVD